MRKFVIFLVVVLIAPLGFIHRLEAAECTNQIVGKTRAQLEADLAVCEQEKLQAEAELARTKQQSASFSRDVAALTAKINAAQANIKGKNIAINNLSRDINTKETKITELGTRIKENKKAIAGIIRKTNEINSYSLVEALLSNKDFSEFFVDVDTYATTGRALDELLAELEGTRKLTETEKQELARKREAEAAAKAALEAAKKEVEIASSEKKVLLAVSQSKEKTYEQIVADRQAKASQIRATLFPLAASGPIPFGTAVQYAKAAEAQTGVRAAYILGIFATESGKASDGTFGKILGNCLLTNSPNKGDGKGKNTGTPFSKVMRADSVRDDASAFMEIAKSLGFDPYSQPVSCPQSFGFGGAMGPAQFIPTTWKLIVPRLTKALGRTPNPWSAQDAFMAASFYLSDLGASNKTYEAERKAAHRYNGLGAPCGTSQYHYCNAVMIRAADIQKDIDFLDSI